MFLLSICSQVFLRLCRSFHSLFQNYSFWIEKKKPPWVVSTVLICHSLRKSSNTCQLENILQPKWAALDQFENLHFLGAVSLKLQRTGIQGLKSKDFFFCKWFSVYFGKFRQSEMSCEVSSDNCQQ